MPRGDPAYRGAAGRLQQIRHGQGPRRHFAGDTAQPDQEPGFLTVLGGGVGACRSYVQRVGKDARIEEVQRDEVEERARERFGNDAPLPGDVELADSISDLRHTPW